MKYKIRGGEIISYNFDKSNYSLFFDIRGFDNLPTVANVNPYYFEIWLPHKLLDTRQNGTFDVLIDGGITSGGQSAQFDDPRWIGTSYSEGHHTLKITGIKSSISSTGSPVYPPTQNPTSNLLSATIEVNEKQIVYSKYDTTYLKITGILDTPMKQSKTLKLYIQEPDGTINTQKLVNDKDGKFGTIKIINKESSIGKYRVWVEYNDKQSSKISFEVIDKETESSKNIPSTTSFTISSDREFYKIGDTVHIKGKALSNISGISYKVIDPNGDIIKIFSSEVNDNGTFVFSFKIEKQFFPLAGGYEIIAWQSRESQDMDSIPITIGIKGVDVIKKAGAPNWIKNNAEWWADGAIDDSAFTQGLQFLIKEKVMNVESKSLKSAESQEIPAWIKNNAKWWADGSIDEGSFLAGIEYLVKEGIIKVN